MNMMDTTLDDPFTGQIIGLAMKVHLTATGLDIGLLINFGSERLQFKRKFRRRKEAQDDSPIPS